MRLYQVMAGARVGGAEAFFERLAPALQADGIEQEVAIRRHPGRAARLRDGGVITRELRFGGALDITTPIRLRRAVSRFRPDIVLAWMNRATAMAPRGPWRLVARLGGYYNLKYYRACDHLVGNTEDIVTYLRDAGWPAERAHYLPNFVADRRAPAEDRARHDTPADVPLALALGRLHPNKGFDVLIEALAEKPGLWLWIAGSGPQEAALRARAERLGVASRVRFLGWRDDPAPLYAACDLFVCSSRIEPLGNIVIEAWAQGRPVVAAAAAGPGRLIEDGRTGLLVPIDDAPALARALDLADDPARGGALAEAGRAAYEAAFTEAIVVARYREFFDRIAG